MTAPDNGSGGRPRVPAGAAPGDGPSGRSPGESADAVRAAPAGHAAAAVRADEGGDAVGHTADATGHTADAAVRAAAEEEEAALLGLAPRAPHRTVRYGPHPSQLIDYHLPDGTPELRVTILHGGFWREAYDRAHLSPLAAALAREGFAVALAEYRRVGGGGGWPATFEDVSRIVATAWEEQDPRDGGAAQGSRDGGPDGAPRAGPERSGRAGGAAAESAGRPGVSAAGRDGRARHVLLGHSAGGHLALWAASMRTAEEAASGAGTGRAGAYGSPAAPDGDAGPSAAPGTGVPRTSARDHGTPHTAHPPAAPPQAAAPGSPDSAPPYPAAPHPLAPDRVVAVSPVAALGRAHERELSRGAVAGLLGGPGAVAELLPLADPLLLPPPVVPVTILHGTADPDVPLALSREYADVMRRAGARVELRERPGGGHYAPLTPGTGAFRELLDALRGLPPEPSPG
ncbi:MULTISPECIES: hypothetical protein [Streptomyces]|uniref:hypothetical protein n=1 Tax=Streptomyces TaxID=1883 RepID=UPI0004D922FE|nr:MULTISPECIES: hypothetical protein [Streptomyces]